MGIFDKMKGKKKSLAPKAQGTVPLEGGLSPKTKTDEKKVAARGPLAREGAGDAHRILVRPIFTEKTARLQSLNQYVFAVAPSAGKVSVAQAIRDLYGVKPESVRIVFSPGKAVRFGKYSGKEKNVKKAIVTLKSGDAIAVLEG